MKAINTWIMLANAETARFFINSGPGKGVASAGEGDLRANPPRPYADRAGAVHNRVGPGISAVAQTDPKALAETEFAAVLCDTLMDAFDAGHFDRLVIAAGPHMLGKIRNSLPDKLSDMVIAEIDKDWTRTPIQDLPDRLKDVMAV